MIILGQFSLVCNFPVQYWFLISFTSGTISSLSFWIFFLFHYLAFFLGNSNYRHEVFFLPNFHICHCFLDTIYLFNIIHFLFFFYFYSIGTTVTPYSLLFNSVIAYFVFFLLFLRYANSCLSRLIIGHLILEFWYFCFTIFLYNY